MEKKCYLISEVAIKVQVEAHVLRYWEEELELEVPRNELGHRQYTQDNIRQFFDIKKLKEEGYQLKAIKELLQQKQQNQKNKELYQIPQEKDKPVRTLSEMTQSNERADVEDDMQKKTALSTQTQTKPDGNVKLEQFRDLMTDIVKQAMSESSREVGQEVGGEIGNRVLKEMNYLMRMQDEQDEERYRKLDEAIRMQISTRKRSKEPRKHSLFRKEKSFSPKLTT